MDIAHSHRSQFISPETFRDIQAVLLEMGYPMPIQLATDQINQLAAAIRTLAEKRRWNLQTQHIEVAACLFAHGQGVDIGPYLFKHQPSLAHSIFVRMLAAEPVDFPAISISNRGGYLKYEINGVLGRAYWDGEEFDATFLHPINTSLKAAGIGKRWVFWEGISGLSADDKPRYQTCLQLLTVNLIKSIEQQKLNSELQWYVEP